jgi:metal-responsive CopG/Arc/MetJ family transcriptional regulator
VAREELVFNGVKLPASWHDKITEIADRRGVDRSSIIKEAIKSYLDDEENPERIVAAVEKVLRERPGVVAEAIEIYSLRKLQK